MSAFPPFTISQAKIEDMPFILSLAEQEGWNPGLNDEKAFYFTDPQGFFIGELAHEKMGCISAVSYNDHFGFIGLYIILPPYRGQGFGIQLWKHALRYLEGRCIGLDGVVAQQENYKKSGFQLHYKNMRFECAQPKRQGFSGLEELHKVPLELVLNYDRRIFGLDRGGFLQHWFGMSNAIGLAKVEQSELRGYGVLRRCKIGYKIGPLFADNVEIAKEIYDGLCARALSGPVYIDIPEPNVAALKLVEAEKLTKVFETARMYTRAPPEVDLDRVFGITTFELG
jgi:GNAT superfamily N-acetyltransferase